MSPHNRPGSPVRKPCVVFGMNTMFAVRQFLPEILAMVQARGMHPVVIAPAEPDDVRELAGQGVELRCIAVKREIAIMADVVALWRLWRILLSLRPSVSNMSTPKMGLLGGLAGWAAGVPHRIYTLRGLRYETTLGWKRRLLQSCERVAMATAHQVVCISRSVRDTVVRDGLVHQRKTVLLGDRASEGITAGRMRRPAGSVAASLRDALSIDPAAAVIGFVGRLTRDKGIGDLVRAFRILKSEGRNIHLLLVGEAESGDPVEPEILDWLRHRNDIHCTGYLSNPAPCMELMDVFVFPTYREGLPTVLLEAAAMGKPVVSTRTTGVVDVVVEGVTGILVTPGDVSGIVAAVKRILDDPFLAARMETSAMKLVEEHFDNSVFLNRLGDMLESLAAADHCISR